MTDYDILNEQGELRLALEEYARSDAKFALRLEEMIARAQFNKTASENARILLEGKSQNPRKVMSELPRRRTSTGYEVQIPDGTWLRTNRFADWFKKNSGVFVQENRNAVTPGGNLDGKHKGVS